MIKSNSSDFSFPEVLNHSLKQLGFEKKAELLALLRYCKMVGDSLAILNLKNRSIDWLCIEKFDFQWVKSSLKKPFLLTDYIHPEDIPRILTDIEQFHRFELSTFSTIYRTNDKDKHWHWDLFDVYALDTCKKTFGNQALVVMRHLTKALGNSHFAEMIIQEKKAGRSKVFDFRLTPREKEVLILIGKAKSDKEIANELMVSPLTIATHRRNLLKKLNARNKNELIKMVHENMLV